MTMFCYQVSFGTMGTLVIVAPTIAAAAKNPPVAAARLPQEKDDK